jgi:phosphatidylglycerol---prolipoprotein diacylglyceryl transferase
MHRELITNPHVASFSALLFLAFFAAWFLARWNAGRIFVERRHIDNQALLLVACSMFGARFFSWLFYFPPGTNFWKAMTAVSGGLVFYGGVIFAAVAVVGYALLRRVSLRRLANIWAAPVALGLAIGRIGCFMAGCCWGDVCMPADRSADIVDSVARRQVFTLSLLSGSRFPLALRFPAETGAYEQHRDLGLIPAGSTASLPVHPAQLYEAAAVLLLALFLQRKFVRHPIDASLLSILALGYGIIRFLVEFVRADNPPIYFGLTLSQVISLIFISWALIERRAVRATVAMPEANLS